MGKDDVRDVLRLLPDACQIGCHLGRLAGRPRVYEDEALPVGLHKVGVGESHARDLVYSMTSNQPCHTIWNASRPLQNTSPPDVSSDCLNLGALRLPSQHGLAVQALRREGRPRDRRREGYRPLRRDGLRKGRGRPRRQRRLGGEPPDGAQRKSRSSLRKAGPIAQTSRRPSEVREMVDSIERDLQCVDILVNNAGIALPTGIPGHLRGGVGSRDVRQPEGGLPRLPESHIANDKEEDKREGRDDGQPLRQDGRAWPRGCTTASQREASS